MDLKCCPWCGSTTRFNWIHKKLLEIECSDDECPVAPTMYVVVEPFEKKVDTIARAERWWNKRAGT
jgi:hypothetical protein